MPHQISAVAFFRNNNGKALFFHATGTGKSYAILECAKRIWEAKGEYIPVLILCPVSVITQWEEEIQRYLGESYNHNITVTNYEKLLNKEYLKQILNTKWTLVAADECQKIANPSAKISRAFKKIPCAYKIAASATPNPNRLSELWSILTWFEPGIWEDSFWKFKNYQCVLNHFGGIVGYKDERMLREKAAKYIHRVGYEVLVDLPDKTTSIIKLKLSEEHQQIYNSLKTTYQIETKTKKITIPSIIALISRLRQLTDCPRVFGFDFDTVKIEELNKILSNKKSTICFVEHQDTANRISEIYDCPKITGSTPIRERNNIVKDFQNDKTNLLVMTSAGQTGLNLQKGKRCVHFSWPWNPGRVDQRVGRIWRHGQTTEIEEIFLLAVNTIDDKMSKLIENKRKQESKFNKEELLALLK